MSLNAQLEKFRNLNTFALVKMVGKLGAVPLAVFAHVPTGIKRN